MSDGLPNWYGDECVYDGSWRNLEKFDEAKDANIKACALLLLAPDLQPLDARAIKDYSGRDVLGICEEKGRTDISDWLINGVDPSTGLMSWEDWDRGMRVAM